MATSYEVLCEGEHSVKLKCCLVPRMLRYDQLYFANWIENIFFFSLESLYEVSKNNSYRETSKEDDIRQNK